MASAKERTLMSYSPDIKVMDCTLRDGGLVNSFRFSDKFVKALYQIKIYIFETYHKNWYHGIYSNFVEDIYLIIIYNYKTYVKN